MRSLTFTVRRDNGFHPASRQLIGDGEVRRERLYHFNVLDDGTCVLLVRVRGDLDRVRTLARERADVLGFSLSEADDDVGLAFVHTRPPEVVEQFMGLPQAHEVFFDFPLEGVGETGLRVTMVGRTNEALQRALEDVPADVETDVERIGPYPPGPRDITSLLTDRQREILDVAMELGYYDSPRVATHTDIATAVGLAPATVSEHMQKIEARVFRALYDGTHPGEGQS